MKMQILIRANASSRLGTGHVMRCITLALSIRDNIPADIRFVCNADIPQALAEDICCRGFSLSCLSGTDEEPLDMDRDARETAAVGGEQCDWLIVDHYGLDARWEQLLRPYVRSIFVIDDLANRPHDCDVLLDQNLYPDMDKRYIGLLPEHALQLLGPEFALLRNDFFRLSENAVARTQCQCILVNFGGSDPTNELGKMLPVVESEIGKQFHFIVVAGPANSRVPELRAAFSPFDHVTFYENYSNMAELLASVDLAIGAGGISMWERCYMGVPSVIITVAENQKATVMEAAKRGLAWHIGASGEVRTEQVTDMLEKLLNKPELLAEQSRAVLALTETQRRSGRHPILSILKGEL
ncbi:UDP-2,4-diacetamido-2,4,6-trideoxy-beta-L-altropyranose hydrolase [Paenibacillus kribbensis]|uniref:UDP-2,4-diacetamido-2,4, 6-trideoxy-beta-L-altropyranose hydrolase n=1 Tax=Paenibacillus kribbensis TaxID=172713 RepID=UPI000837A952|nr:UDP-2,4-diacetamido-2,4,6-trideoxy-beta-L-altropyranose hydrolase [Paenibacillus kribbensis]